MGKLSVFGTEGDAVYPAELDSDPSMARYFSQQVFALQPGQGENDPMVEAYFSARTARGKPNNYSLRYVGDSPETLFEDCREAIQRELVEGLGWTVEQSERGEASVFTKAIWNPDARSNSTQPFSAGQFGLDDIETKVLQNMPSEDDAPPVRITTSRYGDIASILPAFLNTTYTVVVSKERTVPPDWADVQFRPSESQFSGLALHGNTKEYIQNRKVEYQRQQREAEFQAIGESLRELNDLSAEKTEVAERLSDPLGRHFNSLCLLTEQELESEREQAYQQGLTSAQKKQQSKTSGSAASMEESFGPSSMGSKTILLLGLVIAVVIVSAIALSMFLTIPVGQNPSGPDGSAELTASVTSVNSTAFSLNVSGGQGDQYVVSVETQSQTVRNKTVSATSGRATVDFNGLKSSTYTVRVESLDENTTLDVALDPATETQTPTESPAPTPTSTPTPATN